MNPTLTINAYGNVDALHGIFNAVAMVMGSGDYGGIINIAIVIGFLIALMLMVNPNHFMKGPYWFLSVAIITTVLIAPKATVSIEDRLGMQPPAVVANVPWSLAAIMQVKSAVGFAITNLFETAFQTIPSATISLPSELSYLNHGVMFGNRLVRASREAQIVSVNDQADIVNYLRNCIFPSLAYEAAPGSFSRSTAIINEIAAPNPALQTHWHDASGAMQFGGCAVAWPQISTKVMAAGNSSVAMMAARMMPDQSAAVAGPAVASSLEAIYGKAALAAAATSAQDIMVQNTLINATADAAALQNATLGDPSMLMLASARTQAVQSMNAGNLVAGRIAEEALPIVRNLTEAILVALYPLVLALLIASDVGRVFKLFSSYLYTMLWVELWPPIFAVLNWLQTNRASVNLTGSATMDTGVGLSMATATGVYGTAVSDMGVAAWMVTFVPLIAGALVFGMDRIMTIAGGRPGSAEASRAGDSASKGNNTLGNVSIGQQAVAEYRTDPGMQTTTSTGGTMTRDLFSGTTRYQHAMSSGPISTNDVVRMGSERAAAADASLSRAKSDNVAAEQSTRAAWSEVDSLVRSGGVSTQAGNAWRKMKSADEAAVTTDTQRLAESLGAKYGVKDTVQLGKMIQGSIGGGIGSVSKFIGANGSLMGFTRDQSSADKDISEGLDAISSNQVDRRNQLASSFVSSNDFTQSVKQDSTAQRNISANLERSQSYRRSADDSLRESQTYSEQSRKISAIVRDMSVNGANHLYDFAASMGYHPHSGNITQDQWADILTRYAETGQIKIDDSGMSHWVQSNGIQFIQPHPQAPGDLVRDHQAATPMGGEAAVTQQATRNAGAVKAAQRAAGASPNIGVGGSDLKDDVGQAQKSAQDQITVREANHTLDKAGLQDRSDKAFENAPGAPGTVTGTLIRTIDGTTAKDSPVGNVWQERPRPGHEAQEKTKENSDAAWANLRKMEDDHGRKKE